MSSFGLALLLVLRTYDTAGLSPGEMSAARLSAADSLRTAGIEVAWVTCDRIHQPQPDVRCETPVDSATVVVRLVMAPLRVASGVLAQSYVDPRAANGSLATLYVDQVRELAKTTLADPGALMGRAIAHEVGHLLAGTSAHAPAGLMRAVWTASAIDRNDPRSWAFSVREGEVLRRNLYARISAAATLSAIEVSRNSR